MIRKIVRRDLFYEPLQGTEHAVSFNLLLCRKLVMKVNVAVQERNVTYRISLVPRPHPDFIPIFLHGCEIKSGWGLGTKLL